MTLSFGYGLAVGAALVCCGAFTVAWRRERPAALASLPMFAAGGAICMAAVTRFAAGAQDPATGEELAALVSMMGLAGAILGAAWSRGGAAR